jgi:hypothetical protein
VEVKDEEDNDAADVAAISDSVQFAGSCTLAIAGEDSNEDAGADLVSAFCCEDTKILETF